MLLTDTMLRNLKSGGTPAKLADSEGLYLYLSASGGKLWRMHGILADSHDHEQIVNAILDGLHVVV